MKTIRLILILAMTLSVTFSNISFGSSGKVFVRDGNIYYASDEKKQVQITFCGKDRAPILSPNDKSVVYIRKSEEEAYLATFLEDDCSLEARLADQLWIINLDGTNERMLVKDRRPEPSNFKGDRITEELQKVITHIDDDSLKFSPDGKKIYFITFAWATSGAVHSVHIDGSDEKFVTSGNTLKIIDRGKYQGYLITAKHKYFITGGTYDWYWLVSPEGEEIGPLGDGLDSVDWDFLYSESRR